MNAKPQVTHAKGTLAALSEIVAHARNLKGVWADMPDVFVKAAGGPPARLALHNATSAYAEVGGHKTKEPLIFRGVALRGSIQIVRDPKNESGEWNAAPETRVYASRVQGGTPGFMLADPTPSMNQAVREYILNAANADPIAPALLEEADKNGALRDLDRHASTVLYGADSPADWRTLGAVGEYLYALRAVAAHLDAQGPRGVEGIDSGRFDPKNL